MTSEDIKHNLALISTDKRVLSQAKAPWNDEFIKEQKVEKSYLFTCILSKSLYPFVIKDTYTLFLPISKNLQIPEVESLPPYSKMFYLYIDDIYMKYKKETTDFETLFENLNHWGKLTKKMQLAKYKVVYNASGTNLRSAVILSREILIDYTLIYYGTDNIDEAYYLCAMLNSDFIEENLTKIKSSRHIMKKVLEIPIPQFDPNDSKHIKLSQLALQCEKILNGDNNIKKHKYSLNKMRQMVMQELSEINAIVESMFL